MSKSLRIALDVSAVTAQPSGVGLYALNLARALHDLGGEAECLLISNRTLGDHPALRHLRHCERRRFPTRAVWMQFLLPGLLRQIAPDICHFTNSLAPVRMEFPYAVSIHDMSLTRFPSYHVFPKRYYSRLLIPHVARHANRVLTDSEFSRREIQALLGIPRRRITSIPLAADPRFHPVADPVEAERLRGRYALHSPYLIFVGTLEPRKNLGRLIEAFARLNAAGRDGQAALYLVGQPGWQSRRLFEQIERLGLGHRIIHLGYLPAADLPGLYRSAAAAVYPSLLEGFGLPVLEAMACGTPVLTSQGSSLEEVAGDAALYIDPWSIESIENGLHQILHQEELRRDLSIRGLQRAARFSWKETARRTLETYRQILTEPKSKESGREFRLIVELPSPQNPFAAGPFEGKVPECAAEELAVLKTIVYASLFDYPLTLEELTCRLFDLPLDKDRIGELLQQSLFLESRIEKTGDYFHLRGASHLVNIRRRRQAATTQALENERWALKRLSNLRWVRMAALSGATAHCNMEAGDDLDLFFIVTAGRLWVLFLGMNLAAKLLRKRRRLCINFLIDEASLALPQRDFFSADQLLSLRPLCGSEWYDALLLANPWVFEHFPNQRAQLKNGDSPLFSPVAKESIAPKRNRGLSPFFDALDRWILRVYGPYLLRKARGHAADIDLSRQTIKAHLRSHKEDLGKKFRAALQRQLQFSDEEMKRRSR